MHKINDLKGFLDEKVEEYNTTTFISTDPVSIPHQFSLKEDIEIAGLLAATIAWGQRKTILNNSNKLMDLMGNSPYDFIMNHSTEQLNRFDGFKHRTFNSDDLVFFIQSLKNIYENHGGIEALFVSNNENLFNAIDNFRDIFFSIAKPINKRTQKHVSSPAKGSASKRLHMYLRWMVRQDKKGVDFGIWNKVSPSQLSCPLDVHSGNVARALGVLKRTQNDAKAVLELDESLREFDKIDPSKYDFALFGLGVFEGFK